MKNKIAALFLSLLAWSNITAMQTIILPDFEEALSKQAKKKRLYDSIQNGDVNKLRQILEKKAVDVNKIKDDNFEYSPLLFAIHFCPLNNASKIIELLAAHGAIISSKENGNISIFSEIYSSNFFCPQRLPYIFKALLENGFDIDAKDKNNNTLLHIDCYLRQYNSLIFSCYPSINQISTNPGAFFYGLSEDIKNLTPMHILALAFEEDIEDLMEEQDDDYDYINSELKQLKNYLKTTYILLQRGAKIDVKNSKGKTAIVYFENAIEKIKNRFTNLTDFNKFILFIRQIDNLQLQLANKVKCFEKIFESRRPSCENRKLTEEIKQLMLWQPNKKTKGNWLAKQFALPRLIKVHQSDKQAITLNDLSDFYRNIYFDNKLLEEMREPLFKTALTYNLQDADGDSVIEKGAKLYKCKYIPLIISETPYMYNNPKGAINTINSYISEESKTKKCVKKYVRNFVNSLIVLHHISKATTKNNRTIPYEIAGKLVSYTDGNFGKQLGLKTSITFRRIKKTQTQKTKKRKLH